jgi:hypothetical protein
MDYFAGNAGAVFSCPAHLLYFSISKRGGILKVWLLKWNAPNRSSSILPLSSSDFNIYKKFL